MTSFFRWRRPTWGLVVWSGYVVFWMTTVDAAAAMAALWWFAGTIVFGSLWFASRPNVQLGQLGRDVHRVFARPGRIDRRTG
jgi:hypothetical protein